MLKSFIKSFAVVVVGFLVFSSCLDEPEDFRAMQDKLILEYLAQNGIQAEKNDTWGYYYQPLEELEVGTRFNSGDFISIYYTIKVMGSDTYLDVCNPGEHAPQIVKHDMKVLTPLGMDMGLKVMKEGERFRFFLPSYLGYRNFSVEDELEPNAILEVEMEVERRYTVFEYRNLEFSLIDEWIDTWKSQNDPGNNITPIITPSGPRVLITVTGSGAAVQQGDNITLRYKGYLREGEVVEENPEGLSLKVGDRKVVRGLDDSLPYFRKGGGKGLVLVPSHLAYPNNKLILPERYNDNPITCITDLIFEIEIQ
jgi:FKBP-type peptidyl-prolyl cis-trans isomerase FkpA